MIAFSQENIKYSIREARRMQVRGENNRLSKAESERAWKKVHASCPINLLPAAKRGKWPHIATSPHGMPPPWNARTSHFFGVSLFFGFFKTLKSFLKSTSLHSHVVVKELRGLGHVL